MKRVVICIIALFSAAALAKDLPQTAAGQGKDTVAVYMAGEEPKGALGSHKIMGGELEKAISRSKSYIAVNRTEDVLDALAKEHGYSRSGAVDDAQIQKIGEQLGVRYLCIVEISEANRGYYVATRLVDVVSAKILKTSSAGSRLEDYNEQMAVAQRLARELTGVDLGAGRQTPTSIKPKPKRKEKYPYIVRRLDNKIGIEAGGALSLSSCSSSKVESDWYFDGENFYADYEKGNWWGNGGYLRIDMMLLELFVDGVPYSESNTPFGSGALICKLPIGNEVMKVFSIAGVGGIIDSAGAIGGPLIFGGRVDIGSEIIYVRSEYLYASGNISRRNGSVMVSLKNGYAKSLKIGGGLDIGLGYKKNVYLRHELLYNWIETSGEYNSTRHDLNIRLGMGYKWGVSKKKNPPNYSQQATLLPPAGAFGGEEGVNISKLAVQQTTLLPPAGAFGGEEGVNISKLAVQQTTPLLPAATGASIIIHSKPDSADVYIGDRFIGKANQKLWVPVGTHEVKFVKADAEKTEIMTFQPGENTIKAVYLETTPPRPKVRPVVREVEENLDGWCDWSDEGDGGDGGFVTDIDALLAGVGGLKSGSDGGVGRKGVAPVSVTAPATVPGFGGGSIDNLLGGLRGGGNKLDHKKRGEFKVSSPDFLRGGQVTGGRSRASIQRVAMQNMAALRYAYYRRLLDKPGLNGKITVKFTINEFGTITSTQVVESTMDDPELERTVAGSVNSWNFDKIDKPGDVTEVVYPIVFSQ